MMGADAVRCRKRAAAASGYAYWRIAVTYSGAYPDVRIAEVQFRSEVGGASESVGGTPISDTYLNSSYAPAKAFDGSYTTYYLNNSALGWPADIGYIHPTPIEVAEVLIQCHNQNFAPRAFRIERSTDGVTWEEVASFSEPSWSNYQAKVFAL